MSSSDQDHSYKLQGKRMAWALGYVPLINVPVTLPANTNSRAGTDLTDADVLGFRFSPSGGVSRLLIDCKTTTGRAVDRVLWVRGLQDVLHLEELYLFKKKVPENARWLAHELKVNCLDEGELHELDTRLGLNRLKGPYFDGSGYENIETLLAFPKGSEYRAVAQFLRTTLWTLKPAHRVLTLLNLGQQNDLHKKLRLDDRAHMCLVLLATRALAISLGLLTSELNVVDVLNVESRLREELHGGAESLAQKVRFADAIRRLTGDAASQQAIDHEEFPRLLEEVNRLLIRRYALNDAIRITDLALHYFAAGTGTLPRHLSGSDSNLSAKMASDILALFVKSNSLDIGFSRAIINLLATTPEVVSEQSDDQRQEVSGKGEQFSLLAPLPPLEER
ncbi:hypothetical protein KTE49_11085 [Burkholderia multivorans]|uniref:hypothetical protein n=3 Tax=Burkholderia multivorans TaxID=87883 RepID=UPI0011B1CEE8|nr:hypothetical protein [Burkholderia multivorans]MBJ9618511.1 hypothetical protein [Burkholderia multivorans]MBR8107226.1 hypothetical protein [Burkholderia multivorans]MBR8336958.1 hypothetical protein [Burkholderia multivorans]MBU9125491.1 hypothetical protein [Burkholderia multivorans]MBU9327655.1 hypothetical protein [Burkholderia multivorans]